MTNSAIVWVLIAFAVYLIGMIFIGALYMKQNNNSEDYFLGGRNLGGFVAATAYLMQMPLFIVIVGFIYLAEVLSVIIQVSYFKATGGKRIFKMAPIHHHFELCGWSETRVVAVFSIVTAILCLIGLLAL